MGLSLSTSWNAFRYEQGAELLFEIKELGFEQIELSFNLTSCLLSDIEQGLKRSGLRVSSVHNFCPAPDEISRELALPDCNSLASPNPEERGLALKYAKRSIDTASRLAAKAVVLHCGRVEVPDKTRELINLLAQGRRDSPEFKTIKNAAIEERARRIKPFFANTLNSLEELARYAGEKGISLGIETRYYYREIPSLEEISIILDKFKGGNIFYWHDVGHAQLMENLGFNQHREYLEQYGKNLLGVHLHDITAGRDHQAPGKGEYDFRQIAAYLNKETIKVIEAHHPAAAREIRESKELLEKIFDGRI
ncbi:MAG: sugar phosphate isomerase/epimerase [Candidatus Omnitrophota bacterium]|nr:sugar phosphate isomerase/epimerase [Candidatus Omnitrophota bacterium]